MTLSGYWFYLTKKKKARVLIPLLVDDPLWGFSRYHEWNNLLYVLIPLLVDDPLWAFDFEILHCSDFGLNPSFSGWPSLGMSIMHFNFSKNTVLIPLLVDDPLWVSFSVNELIALIES